jgi:hypothetical protein
LTRRANHRHIFIIAKVMQARAEKSAAGFFVESFRVGRQRHERIDEKNLTGKR